MSMTHNATLYIFFLITCTMIIPGCTDNSGEQEIDASYLNSDHYKQFQQKISGERAFRRDEGNELGQIVDSLYERAKKNEIALPLQLDSASVENYTRSGKKMTNQIQTAEYTYYPVGVFGKKGIEVLIFIMQKRTMGQNREIVLATVTQSEIKNVKTAAPFKKTISLMVNSKFVVDEARKITVHTTRTRFYPIRQENTEIFRYKVANDGTIERKIASP